jgi:hypothetical protein
MDENNIRLGDVNRPSLEIRSKIMAREKSFAGRDGARR